MCMQFQFTPDSKYQGALKAQANKPGDTSVGVETAVWDLSFARRTKWAKVVAKLPSPPSFWGDK